MPEEALDGDTEGRSRDEKKESDESEEQSNNMTRKKSNDSEVEANHVNVKDLRVKHEMADFEEMKEEHKDDNDDDDDDDYSENEDSWSNRVQKRRNEEEKEYVWLRKIDKEAYLKVMTPMYLLLEVRSTSPLPVQQVRQAVSHLSRVWPWWGVGVRHRGQERTPWLCVAPTQRPTLQVSGNDEDDEELWDSVDQQQWRHTKVAEGMLSSVTLITHPHLSAAAAAVTAAPYAHRNEDRLPAAAGGGSGAGASSTTSVSTTTTTTAATADAAACNEDQVKEVPDLPHKGYLMLGIPRPFVEDTTTEVICRTLITLLDDVLSGKIKEEYQPSQESGSHGKDTAEAESPSLESWLAERLQAVVEAKAEGCESNADPESGYQQSEENESDTRGYVQRTFDSVTSCNFINRCKAERVSYVNGFATCVSTAAAAFLLAAKAGKQEEQGQQLKIRQRVCEHLHWPAAPQDWQDGDPDEESPPEPSTNTPPGVTITAPNGEDDSVFWEAARYISQQRWGSQAGGKKGTPMHILHGLPDEYNEDDMPPQRYPIVSLRLCDIQKDEGGAPSVQRVGDVVGLGPHSLSPLRHFLITHTVNLHLEERSQVLSFSLHHSTLFVSPGTGRSFADEIETALKNSLRRR